MKLLLNKHRWYHNGNIYVAGFIRVADRYLTGSELADFFKSPDVKGFGELLEKANGQFAVVVVNGGEVWAATDRLRTIPLFYHSSEERFIIGDSAYAVAAEMSDPCISEEAASAFLATGYTLNDSTLVKDLFQVEAGECIVWHNKVSRSYYHDYGRSMITCKERSITAISLYEAIEDLFISHLSALKDRFIAIPLSGGFDSRLIALMCSIYHPDNILCFTYGRKDNDEVAPAREIARRLELPWINIVYDSRLVKDFVSDSVFHDYHRYASELSSMFFMQDYFAVKKLKDKSMIPDDAVFMPGHSGNFLAGEHVTRQMKKADSSHIIRHILGGHFILNDYSTREKDIFVREICRKFGRIDKKPWLAYESWDIKERQAKFIVNSASVFDYFGYSYVMPLWDNSLISFFNTLPFEYKVNKNLYDEVLINGFFSDNKLNLASELNPTPMQRSVQRMKNSVKRVLPQIVVSACVSHRSPVLYDEISRQLMIEEGESRFRSPHAANLYNSYLTQWYLHKTRALFSGEVSG